jgi:Uma2 family endonuclease
MAVALHLTPEEYLSTSFEGADREYIDGEVIERNVGENKHSFIQCRFAGALAPLVKAKRLVGFTELRLRLSPTLFRIPDVAIYLDRPSERVPSTPPLAVVEIISPDDRHSDLVRKLDEYAAWGVSHIWVIDPELETLTVYSDQNLIRVSSFNLSECGLSVAPEDLF